MKKIVVASNNPVKVQAVHEGYARMFPGEAIEVLTASVPSGVSDQPCTDSETLQGAVNRALNARQAVPDADFWVGIEGGISELHSALNRTTGTETTKQDEAELCAFAWVVVYSSQVCGKSRTGTFILPHALANLVRQGLELGDADDIVFGGENTKQKNGAVGLLTGDAVDRTSFYAEAVVLALIPFKNPEFYP